MTSTGHAETELVHALADGELEPPEAERMRRHVAHCQLCGRELEDALQLKMLELGLQEAAQQQEIAPLRARRPSTPACCRLAATSCASRGSRPRGPSK